MRVLPIGGTLSACIILSCLPGCHRDEPSALDAIECEADTITSVDTDSSNEEALFASFEEAVLENSHGKKVPDFGSKAGHGSIEGYVSVIESKEPIFYMYAVTKGKSTRGHTDFNGYFNFENVEPGLKEVVFYCPTRTRRFKHAVSLHVPVQENFKSILHLALPSTTCKIEKYIAVDSEFSGFYSFGFEKSIFEPCNAEVNGFDTKDEDFGVSVEFAEDVEGHPALKWDLWYYVKWRGTLTGPGSYGHFGMTSHQMLVDEFIDVKVVGGNERNCEKYAKEPYW